MLEMKQKKASSDTEASGGQKLSPAAEMKLAAAKLLREQRLAKALRENLKRRKAQTRSRAQSEEPSDILE